MCDSVILFTCKQPSVPKQKAWAEETVRTHHPCCCLLEVFPRTWEAQGRRDVEIIAVNLLGGSGKTLLR